MPGRRYRRMILLALLLVGSSSNTGARQPDTGLTGRPISGVPGVASQHAVVNLAALARTEAARPAARTQQVIHPLMQLPTDQARATQWPAPDSAVRQEGSPALSPSPGSSFQALPDPNTSIPPDTHGAVGPDHVMTVLNTQVRVQSRTGAIISTVSLNTFWSSVNGGSGAFDPKVFYDPFSSRWMFVTCDDSRSVNSGVLIGVSQTSDPTANWNLFKVDVDATNAVWADYPSVGFNKDWIAVQD